MTIIDILKKKRFIAFNHLEKLPIIFIICAFLSLLFQNYFAFFWPLQLRPDEYFQYFEPASKLSSGHGVMTWEWIVHIRSWLVPGFIAGLMKLASYLHVLPVYFVHFVFSLTFLPFLCLLIFYGRLLGGQWGAFLFGLAGILWPEFIQLPWRTAGETWGGLFIAAAIMIGNILLVEDEAAAKQSQTQKRYFWLLFGFSLGIACAVRFQFLPAAAAAMVFLGILTRDFKNILAAGAAFLLPVLILGGADWVIFGYPFYSILHNYHINETADIAASIFGREPVYYYFYEIFKIAPCGTVLTLCFVFLGLFTQKRRRLYLPLSVSLVIIFYHSFIPHKEVFFVAPLFFLMPVLLLTGLMNLLQPYFLQGGSKVKIISFFIVLLMAFLKNIECPIPYQNQLPSHHVDAFNALIRLEHQAMNSKNFCGIAVVGKWSLLQAGYAWAPAGTGVYFGERLEDIFPVLKRLNILVMPPGLERNLIAAKEVVKQRICMMNGYCLYVFDRETCLPPDYEQASRFVNKSVHTIFDKLGVNETA